MRRRRIDQRKNTRRMKRQLRSWAPRRSPKRWSKLSLRRCSCHCRPPNRAPASCLIGKNMKTPPADCRSWAPPAARRSARWRRPEVCRSCRSTPRMMMMMIAMRVRSGGAGGSCGRKRTRRRRKKVAKSRGSVKMRKRKKINRFLYLHHHLLLRQCHQGERVLKRKRRRRNRKWMASRKLLLLLLRVRTKMIRVTRESRELRKAVKMKGRRRRRKRRWPTQRGHWAGGREKDRCRRRRHSHFRCVDEIAGRESRLKRRKKRKRSCHRSARRVTARRRRSSRRCPRSPRSMYSRTRRWRSSSAAWTRLKRRRRRLGRQKLLRKWSSLLHRHRKLRPPAMKRSSPSFPADLHFRRKCCPACRSRRWCSRPGPSRYHCHCRSHYLRRYFLSCCCCCCWADEERDPPDMSRWWWAAAPPSPLRWTAVDCCLKQLLKSGGGDHGDHHHHHPQTGRTLLPKRSESCCRRRRHCCDRPERPSMSWECSVRCAGRCWWELRKLQKRLSAAVHCRGAAGASGGGCRCPWPSSWRSAPADAAVVVVDVDCFW